MTGAAEMTSSRPYLVRAVHEWIVDNVELPEQEETYDAYQAL